MYSEEVLMYSRLTAIILNRFLILSFPKKFEILTPFFDRLEQDFDQESGIASAKTMSHVTMKITLILRMLRMMKATPS